MKTKTAEKKSEYDFKNIHRSNTNKVIAGVAGGLGEHFNVDPIIFRIIFLILFVYGGSGLLIYLILWLVIPKKNETFNDNVEEIKEKANELVDKVRGTKHETRRQLIGFVFIGIGIIFLLDNMGIVIFHEIWKFWPLILVLVGISIIIKNK